MQITYFLKPPNCVGFLLGRNPFLKQNLFLLLLFCFYIKKHIMLYLRQIQNSLFSIFTNDSLCEDPIVKCLFVTIKYFHLLIFIAPYKNLRFVPFLNLFLGSTVIYSCTTWQLMEPFVSGWMIPHTRSVSVGCNVLHTTLSLHINCPDAIISDLLLPQIKILCFSVVYTDWGGLDIVIFVTQQPHVKELLEYLEQ